MDNSARFDERYMGLKHCAHLGVVTLLQCYTIVRRMYQQLSSAIIAQLVLVLSAEDQSMHHRN
jgi:hypothetical protein